jgi:hypothetical protein
VRERFLSNLREEGDCLVWIASTDGRGYGQMYVEGRRRKATHVSWFLATGEWPSAGLSVCHRCDNPPCVRIEHLFVGTHRENMRDAHAKGRLHGNEKFQPGWQRTLTHCKRGHPFDDANTIHRPRGQRACRECARVAQIHYNERRRGVSS